MSGAKRFRGFAQKPRDGPLRRWPTGLPSGRRARDQTMPSLRLGEPMAGLEVGQRERAPGRRCNGATISRPWRPSTTKPPPSPPASRRGRAGAAAPRPSKQGDLAAAHAPRPPPRLGAHREKANRPNPLPEPTPRRSSRPVARSQTITAPLSSTRDKPGGPLGSNAKRVDAHVVACESLPNGPPGLGVPKDGSRDPCRRCPPPPGRSPEPTRRGLYARRAGHTTPCAAPTVARTGLSRDPKR